MTVGLGRIKKALVSGNYFNEKGIGFGGMEKQQSVRILEEFLVERGLFGGWGWEWWWWWWWWWWCVGVFVYESGEIEVGGIFFFSDFFIGLNKPLNGIFLIDVHTGLGPSGIDTLMTSDDVQKVIFILLFLLLL